ncbi:glutamate--tRNA ligase [archaeon]|nr:MAG: glutamate--tRNA ligase [archaeon]
MMDKELKETVLKIALKNAILHDGKASLGPVLGKLVAEKPDVKPKIKEIIPIVREVIEEVNRMPIEKQKQLLEEIAPEKLEERKTEGKRELPRIEGLQEGRVVTRFAPEPNGYLHIGHALTAFINYYYRKTYGGVFWLRFEDTNPRKEKIEFYEAIEEDLKWLGIRWDKRKCNSEDMPLYYEYARKLISNRHAYVCECELEKIRKYRLLGKECKCRTLSPEDHLEKFEKMLEGAYREGEATIRLRGDMSSPNTTLRDPVIFRIIEAEHPIQGDKYIVWPTYDYACSIQDGLCRITHVLRSAEFEIRTELQNMIRELLGLPNPIIVHYSRFNVKGTPTSKREITRLIDEGIVKGWDDPRLVTLRALRRRGILPKTIEDLMYQIGLSKANPIIDWKLLTGLNRKNVDKIANRYFAVINPILLEVENAPEREISLPIHPDKPEEKVRKFTVGDQFYISALDAKGLKRGEEIRLKDLYNIKIVDFRDSVVRGVFVDFKRLLKKKIQWVPIDQAIKLKVYVPMELIDEHGNIVRESMKTEYGYVESNVTREKVGNIVQFERYGFCRLEKISKENVEAVYAHD